MLRMCKRDSMERDGRPMSEAQLDELREFLGTPLGRALWIDPDTNEVMCECDDTFRITEQWLRDEGLSVPTNIRILQSFGATCDCDVIFCVIEEWPDATNNRQCYYHIAFPTLNPGRNHWSYAGDSPDHQQNLTTLLY
jgi:hypothetical protein